jgi:hypothetical protein
MSGFTTYMNKQSSSGTEELMMTRKVGVLINQWGRVYLLRKENCASRGVEALD